MRPGRCNFDHRLPALRPLLPALSQLPRGHYLPSLSRTPQLEAARVVDVWSRLSPQPVFEYHPVHLAVLRRVAVCR